MRYPNVVSKSSLIATTDGRTLGCWASGFELEPNLFSRGCHIVLRRMRRVNRGHRRQMRQAK
jgi:hypothetical protein